MRLKLVYQGNFCKNERTLFEEALKQNDVQLGPDDCVLLVSKGGKLLKFVRRSREISYVNGSGKNGHSTTILASDTYRITGYGKWSPLMLSNYAAEVGVELEGIKKFEAHYKVLRGEKA